MAAKRPTSLFLYGLNWPHTHPAQVELDLIRRGGSVEVQGQLHTYVHECGSRDRIDPGLRGQWVWLWVTPMSKITRYAVEAPR